MSNVFREQIATVSSINRVDAAGTENTGVSYKAGLVKAVTARWSFAIHGGTQGAKVVDLPYTLKSGSIVFGSISKGTTTVTSGGAAVFQWGLNTGIDLNAAGVTIAQINAGWYEARASAVAPVVLTADRSSVNFTIGTADATAGVVQVTLLYIEPNDQ